MTDIDFIRNLINDELAKLSFKGTPAELYEPIDYTMSQEGKRLRPFLCVHTCDIFEGNIKDAIFPALGIEVFHNFTLVHDDVMDDADIRRGKPTVYKKWNTNIALLSGDTMFAKAFELVCRTREDRLKQVLEVFTTTAIEVCEGQQYDMNFETSSNVSIEEYLEMIRLKTAVLIAACLKVGAIISGTSAHNVNELSKFGEAIGITFQLQDDWLDTYAEESKFGKKIGNDIVTNKKTFLWLKALEIADHIQKSKLIRMLNASISDTEKVYEVKKIFDELDVSRHTRELMEVYYKKAILHLDSVEIPETNKAFLKNFADKLMNRDK